MPQGERTKNIKAMLKWLTSKRKVTVAQLQHQVKTEITEMGGTDRTIRSYIADCINAGFIKDEGAFLSATPLAKEWVARHI